MTTSSKHKQKPTEGAAQTADSETVAAGYTRLHITPFDHDLLRIILPSAVLPAAKDISYHALQTFPEKRYGFVNLPDADAEKIRKKLNGAILRGSKVRIEPARPDDMARSSEKQDPSAEPETSTGKDEKKRSKKHKKEKKRKRDYDEIPGVELEDGRKVKRGWTVSGESHTSRRDKEKGNEKRDKVKKKELKRNKEIKSKYSDGPECLVKTRLPPNKASLAGAEDEPDLTKKRKKSKGSSREVVVHEFEKTTKFATFLRQSQSTTADTVSTEYVDGKGWIDADGNVVEASRTTRPTVSNDARPPKRKQSPAQDSDETSSSSSGSSDDEDEQDNQPADREADAENAASLLATSDEDDIDVEATSPQTDSKSDAARPKSSGSARSLTIKIPPATPATQKVHPLEALYKRAKTGDNADATASNAQLFSFFDTGDIEEEQDATPARPQVPMTPFTQRDFDWRNTRSAAPTPDTAHANKTFKFWSGDNEKGDSDEEADEQEHANVEQEQEPINPQDGGDDTNHEADGDKVATDPTTNFQKWFWENRGDLNRSWKKRRKMAAKEKRYRENRARADRAI